jgi:HEAT repeat protein
MPERHRRLIDDLAVGHRAPQAYRELILLGVEALPDVREGLHHSNADVRYHCCRFLDRYLEPESLGDLLDMLDDVDERVRVTTLHTLACDRCKDGACRPNETEVLPRAMKLLASNPCPHVRAMAIEVVGQFVHVNRTAEAALLDALHSDASPAVRKKAKWYAPGGAIYRRTKPTIARTRARY